MSSTRLTGKALRLARLSRPNDGRYLFVPLDHSVTDGPIADTVGFGNLVQEIVSGGADGIVVHKGRARTIPAGMLTGCSLIVHLSASTAHGGDADAKVLVGGVDDAIRIGADAVSVHVNMGSATESAQLADLGMVATACDRWGVPLLAMIYPRGPRVSDSGMPELLSHAVSLAADLGADMVKTVLASPPERMAEVVANSPLPLIVAGGGHSTESLAEFAQRSISVGCHGMAIGRRVFNSPAPQQAVRELTAIIHGHEPSAVPTTRPEVAGML